MQYRHSAEDAASAAEELCAGVRAAAASAVPVQQHMGEVARGEAADRSST